MENCYNHPERKAYSVCHICGKHFCEDCLTAGTEFYYCKSPECQTKFKEDNEGDLTRKEIVCPNCRSVLNVDKYELESGSFRCPECDAFVVILNGKPELPEDKNYVRLLSISNQGDIAIIKSMLDDAGIDYYAWGENSMYDPIVIYVNANQINLAKEILKDFEFHLFGFSTNNGEDA
jgi:uncharacterized protein YbaR (Trm112 family)